VDVSDAVRDGVTDGDNVSDDETVIEGVSDAVREGDEENVTLLLTEELGDKDRLGEDVIERDGVVVTEGLVEG